MRHGILTRRRTWAVAVAGVVSTLLFAQPVLAGGFHDFSHSWESQASATGMQLLRKDQFVFYQPLTGCFQEFAGDAVYQTMWAKYSVSGSHFELGTGHQCGDSLVYWYWGWTDSNGGWHPLGTQDTAGEGLYHVFKINRHQESGNYFIKYFIDGNLKATYATTSTNYFTNLDQGLESYCDVCEVQAYTDDQLQFRDASLVWHSWFGRDGSQVNDPPMCGHWLADNTWQAGEEGIC